MKNLEELIAQIRFQLFQLASKNAHHDFEHLCRHLSRARICSNILPATGPVSTGGDQGKDFETFRTYLNKNLNEGAFVGLTSEKPIAFACTIQKTKLDNKVKSDIKTIIRGDSEIAGVHYFLTQDLPVANRHKLQQWCKDEYSIYLEIYDGQAISELLSDYDVFWIAERYLSIPNDLYPHNKTDVNWYTSLLSRWKSRDSADVNYSDFFELKSAIRKATFNDKYKSDIIFWVDKLKVVINTTAILDLKRKAIYEIVVASLRGLNNLECSFADIDKYFESIENISNPYDIDEALILINYCVGASRHNVFTYDKEKLKEYKNILTSKINERIKEEQSLTNICSLYEIMGFSYISSNPDGFDELNFTEAIRCWNKVAELAEQTPLYALERFTDRLSNIIDLYHDYIEKYYESLDALTIKLDSLLEKRFGAFTVAEKARDRALKYHSKGAITRALKQLHIAKVNWFAEETLKGSIISIILIGSWYSELKLFYASKYYYLAASFLIISSNKPEIKKYLTESLVRLAEVDYLNGNWCSYLDFTELGLIGYNLFSNKEIKEDGTDEFSRIIFHTSIMLTITKQLSGELYDNFYSQIDTWGLNEYFSDALPLAEKNYIFNDTDKLWDELIVNYEAVPLSDIGSPRIITWSQLGISWELTFENNYITAPIAEQFAAIFQILLCDLSEIDLYLISTKVKISISVDPSYKHQINPKPNNKEREWDIKFPYFDQSTKQNIDEIQTFCITSITEIFFEVSLLPYDNLMNIIENSFKSGLSLKIFIAQPYEYIYRNFITQDQFLKLKRHDYTNPFSNRSFPIKSHEHSKWRCSLAELYNLEDSQKAIKRRYELILPNIRFSLPKLLISSDFIDTVNKLKEQGWKDWHILNSIASIIINYRLQQIPAIRNNPDKMREYMLKEMYKPESEDALEVPLSNFTIEKIIMQQQSNMLSTLKGWGLESRQMTPDFDGITNFMIHRFNYYKDDIEHENIFPK